MKPMKSRGVARVCALLGATALVAVSAMPVWAADPSLDTSKAVQQSFHPVPDFSALVKKVMPAVVSVDVKLRVDQTADQVSGHQDQNGLPPGFPQIPGFPPGFPFTFGQPQQPQAVEAKGSGFIINSNGTIVTNNHVVKDEKTVTVTLSDGDNFPAKVIGTDPKTDLAVLKINAGKPLPYVELGDSKDLEPGQWVIAMGNPFGLGNTVTAGIISALGRNIGDGPYDRFIQTDAPINEGNSGGPLLNQKGQVIGVNTAILSPSGGSVGIGFAIPSDMIKRVVTQLIAHGKVTRGFLGVSAQMISPQIAQAMKLPMANPNADGALIAAVAPNSPAEKAGLKQGDVIIAVNGHKVTNPGDLASDIANIDPNHTADISYIRDGQKKDVSVAVEKMPANPSASFEQNGSNGQQTASHGALGLTLAPLTATLRSQLNLPTDATGVVIVGVKQGSLADEAGLQQGDLLVGVGATDVSSPDQAVAAIKAARKSGAGAVALRIVRQGQALFVGITLNGNNTAGH